MDHGESSYRRYLDGDAGAFDEIMRLHFDRVVFFIDRILHDTQLSEDVAIDVFACLAIKKGYDGRSSLRTYLLTLARSRALNRLKAQRAHPTISYEDLSEDESDRAQLEQTVLKSERDRALDRVIGTLPPEMQTVLRLVYFEELSYEQTAHVMKKSKKQIDNLLYRAKNALRPVLEKEGITNEEF